MDQGAATGAITKLLASGPLAWIMRIGYVARGILFLIIGGFALLAAGGLGAHRRGTRDALEFVFQKPFGGYFLWTLPQVYRVSPAGASYNPSLTSTGMAAASTA